MCATHRRALLLTIQEHKLGNVSHGVRERAQLTSQDVRTRAHAVQRKQAQARLALRLCGHDAAQAGALRTWQGIQRWDGSASTSGRGRPASRGAALLTTRPTPPQEATPGGAACKATARAPLLLRACGQAVSTVRRAMSSAKPPRKCVHLHCAPQRALTP